MKKIFSLLQKVASKDWFKLVHFLILVFYEVGSIGGTCYLFYYDEPVCAIGVIITALLALPTVKYNLRELIE